MNSGSRSVTIVFHPRLQLDTLQELLIEDQMRLWVVRGRARKALATVPAAFTWC